MVSNDIIYNDGNIKHIFILSWPYTKNIIQKNINYIENGGIFFKILPFIEIIDKNNYKRYI